MAGNYMDAPNDRVAWDRDGSLLTFITPGGSISTRNADDRRNLNGESEVVVPLTGYSSVAVVFPIPLDCSAVFFATDSNRVFRIETSRDTTNGLDGTWDTQYLTDLVTSKSVKPNYRVLTSLYMLQPNWASSELRGIRASDLNGLSSAGVRAFHIYGTPSTAATKDRLSIWHPTLDTRVGPTYFDWGNVPRGSSADRFFRIKNLSTVLTAADIDVYVEALTPGLPNVARMHTISDNAGATFFPQIALPALLPGEISDVLTLRRVVPMDAQVSTWSARVAADVNDWQGV